MKFPNIYRTITERFNKFKKKNPKLLKTLIFQNTVILYVVTIGLSLFLVFDLLNSLQKQKEINFERAKIESEIKVWEDLTQKYQDYKEGYFQLAVLNYKLGNSDKAKYYVDRALYLDPNFEKARNLQKTLRGY